MFCPKCGVKISRESKFCFNCGNNMENIKDTLKEAEGKKNSLIKENKTESIIEKEVEEIRRNELIKKRLEEKLMLNGKGKSVLSLDEKEEKKKSIFDLDKELSGEKIKKKDSSKKTFSEIKLQARNIINEKLERKTRRMFSFDEEEFEERKKMLSDYFKVPIEEKILFIYDRSEIKENIEGIIMTEKNIYMAGLLKKTDIIPIKEVKQVYHREYALRIGTIMLPIRSEKNTDNFCICMLKIINLLKKY